MLFDFNSGFADLAFRETGIRLPEINDSYPDVWAYDQRDLGAESAGKVWMAIGRSHNFWMKLNPINTRLLQKLSAIQTTHDFYFITTRPGPTAKFQSEVALLRWFQLPTVLITKTKGPIAKGLELDIFVDDKPENCNEVAEATRDADGRTQTIVIMPDRPWNREAKLAKGVLRTKNLEKVLGEMLWPHEVAA